MFATAKPCVHGFWRTWMARVGAPVIMRTTYHFSLENSHPETRHQGVMFRSPWAFVVSSLILNIYIELLIDVSSYPYYHDGNMTFSQEFGGNNMREYDDAVLECFLDKQLQLFPEAVAETLDEAEDFLEECMAVVVDSVDDVIEYFDEAGMDVDGAVDDEILEADEVFDIGDGRYLIVEA